MSFNSINEVTLRGRLGRAPECRAVEDNTVCNFSIAISESFKKGDNWEEKTVWVDITAWGRTAETCERFLKKGSDVIVLGKLAVDTWEKDGKQFSKTKVIARTVQFLDSKSDSKPAQSRKPEPADDDSDLPY